MGLSEQAKAIAWGMLKRLERYGFDVVDEPEGATGATTGPHWHIEYQPKPGERADVWGNLHRVT